MPQGAGAFQACWLANLACRRASALGPAASAEVVAAPKSNTPTKLCVVTRRRSELEQSFASRDACEFNGLKFDGSSIVGISSSGLETRIEPDVKLARNKVP